MLLYRNTHANQQFTGIRLGFIATQLGEFHFQLRHFHAVVFAHFWQAVDAVTLLLYLPQLFVAHDNGVNHGKLFKCELILTQFTQTLAFAVTHVTGTWH